MAVVPPAPMAAHYDGLWGYGEHGGRSAPAAVLSPTKVRCLHRLALICPREVRRGGLSLRGDAAVCGRCGGRG